ncbi:hypothetical protein QYE76_023421 [Lolium multiflorum]|uniref:Uncharacterized protein n=1 Tax=Lolium multiflorum TaxID=4521 RepID=A0AAD8RD91_LOLMU|nr:hypothetical protein QYE76_023421 [Lolium multiflorum]
MALRSASPPLALPPPWVSALGRRARWRAAVSWMYRLAVEQRRCWLVGCAVRCGSGRKYGDGGLRRGRGKGDYGNRLIIAVCAWAVAVLCSGRPSEGRGEERAGLSLSSCWVSSR